MREKPIELAQQLAAATDRRQQLAASLPGLAAAASAAAATRLDATAALERDEGDLLVGAATPSQAAASRARCEAAVTAERAAAATLRQIEQQIARLDEAIRRLAPAAHAARIAEFRIRHEGLVQQVRVKIKELLPLNEALYQNYREAETAFPHVVRRAGGPARAWPVAAGLVDLSWRELRMDPHASNGGRLGSWLKAVNEFLDPTSIPALKVRATTRASATPERGAGPWYPLEGVQ